MELVITSLLGAAGVLGGLGLVERVAQLCRLVGDENAAHRGRFVGIPFSVTWGVVLGMALVMRGTSLDSDLVLPLLFLTAVGLGLFTLLTPRYLVPHLRAALAELAREKNAAVFPRTCDKADDVPTQSTR